MSLRRLRELGMKAIWTAVFPLALVLGGPARAGNTSGGVEQTGTLWLLLDNLTGDPHQFVHLPNDPQDLPTEQAINESTTKNEKCKVELVPESSLVSMPSGSTPWGIDTGKGPALGGRSSGGPKGTGCGQIDFGEIFEIGFPSFLVGGEVKLQVEAKQQAVARLGFFLQGHLVQTRYLISGSIADADLPAEVLTALQDGRATRICPTPDCGNDSAQADDALWEMVAVPLHDLERLEILATGAGTGVISLKSGGDFPLEGDDTVYDNRSRWDTFSADGVLDCFGTFQEGEFSGRRLANEDCTVIPYDAEFDGQLLKFLASSGGQDAQYNLHVCFDPVALGDGSEAETLATFRDNLGNDDADGNGVADCLEDDPPSCFPLELCVGTPVYECLLDDPSADVCGASLTCTSSGGPCETDADCGNPRTFRTCDLGLGGPECFSGETCELVGLQPEDPPLEQPTNCEYNGGSYPDCDNGPENGTNYACWYRQTETYVPPEDTLRVCQDLFISDDFLARGGGGGGRK